MADTKNGKNNQRRSTKNQKNSKKTTNKTNNKPAKKHKVLKIVLLVLLTLTLIGGLLVGGLVFKYKKDLKEINQTSFWVAKSSTNVYDRNNEYIGSLSLNNIRWTELKDAQGNQLVAQDYLNGLIATEDQNFYHHHGVDYLGMVKGAVSTLLMNNDRGGSSITMQLAKIIYMDDWTKLNDEGVDRRSQDKIGYKITQMLYAHGIESQFTKDEILTNYVNVVGFGDAGYGIVNASEYYYDKTPAELTLPESAMLAGMSQLPGVYNPYTNPEGTKERRDAVLLRMLDEKYISQEQYDAAVNTPIDAGLVSNENRDVSNFVKYQGYLDVVYQEFLDLIDPEGTGNFDVNTAGMNIYTNMDKNVQAGVYDIINSNSTNLFIDDVIQEGVTIMDSSNGEVMAIGNGRNGHSGFFGTNYAYNYNRQPGSTAKPIVDAGPAIEYLDWSTAHPLNDAKISYDGGPEVNNADGKYLGWISLRESLCKSRNTTALQTFKEVSKAKGIDTIYNFVKNLGFDQINQDEFNQAYAIGGWQYGTTTYQLAGAYAAFGNGGVYNTPHVIRQVTINPESIYYEKYGDSISPNIESKRVMKESTAFMISEMLKSTQPEAKGYAPYSPAIPSMSVKTGTSDWGSEGLKYNIPEASQRDKWIAGFNKNLTVVTWMGYTQEYEAQGKYIPEGNYKYYNIYTEILNMISEVGEDKYSSNGDLEQPSNVEAKKAKVSGNKIVMSSSGSTYYFIKGSTDAGSTKEEEKVNKPSNVKTTIDAEKKTINITWDDSNADAEYIIKIDGKEVNRTKDKNITLSYQDLVNSFGCKQKYDVQIVTTKKIDDQDKQSDPSDTISINFPNTDFCQPTPTPQQNETGPATSPPTTG